MCLLRRKTLQLHQGPAQARRRETCKVPHLHSAVLAAGEHELRGAGLARQRDGADAFGVTLGVRERAPRVALARQLRPYSCGAVLATAREELAALATIEAEDDVGVPAEKTGIELIRGRRVHPDESRIGGDGEMRVARITRRKEHRVHDFIVKADELA